MNTEKIGKYILKLRKEKGMTQEQLAIKVYVTNKAVSRWERGLSLPEFETLYLLSKTLDVSINDILEAGTKKENEVKDYYQKKRLREVIFDIILISILIILPFFTVLVSIPTSVGVVFADLFENQPQLIENINLDVTRKITDNYMFVYSISFILLWIPFIISYLGYKLKNKYFIYFSIVVYLILIGVNIFTIDNIGDIVGYTILNLILIIVNIIELAILKKRDI